ncbi:hypothetical protein CR513_51185, partial [Mucuna pruriens]
MFLLQIIWTLCFKLFKIFFATIAKRMDILSKNVQQGHQVDSPIPSSFPNPSPIQQNVPSNVPTLIPRMVQQMIISSFSTLGFLGKSSSPWYFNSRASNHITSNAQLLTNIKNIMEISRSILLMGINCLSLQLNQNSGKKIVKGPKVGCLFPIRFLLSPNLFLPLVSCNFDIVDYQCLGHPNSNILHDMLKYDFLGNKHTSSLNVVHFDCISCKLAKSKILSFLTHHSNVTQPFDIIHSDVWEVAPNIYHANCKYFLTFIDNYSCFT